MVLLIVILYVIGVISKIDSNKISNWCILKFTYYEGETLELLVIINHDFSEINN